MKLKNTLLQFVWLFLALSLAAAEARELKVVMGNYPANLMPLFNEMVTNRLIAGFILRPVTANDANVVLSCILCEELPTVENGLAKRIDTPQGPRMSVTYRLKKQFKWSDGQPVTADDVIFTLKVGMDTRVPVADRVYYRAIHEVRKIDDYSFEVIREATADFNSLNEIYILNHNLDGPVYERNPSAYHQSSLYLKDVLRDGLYMGPYKLSQVRHGDRVELVPNPHWPGPPLPLTKITIQSIHEPMTITLNLLAGKIDMVVHLSAVPPDQLKELEKSLMKKKSHRLITVVAPPYQRLSFNLRSPQLQDPRVRRALGLALDRSAILNGLLSSRYQAATSPIKGIGEPAPPHANRDEALRLLAEAGWKLNSNNKLTNKEGKQMQVRLLTASDKVEQIKVTEAIRPMWEKIGVEVTGQPQNPSPLFQTTLPNGDFEVEMSGRYTDIEEGSLFRSFFHSANIPSLLGEAASNLGAYSNREMDALIPQLEHELNPQARRELMQKLISIYYQDPPEIPLYSNVHDYMVPPWLEFTPSRSSSPISMWVENWRVTN